MPLIQNAHFINYLKDKKDTYTQIFGVFENKRFQQIYSDVVSPLDEIFAFFHFQFNNLLRHMNSRLNTRHYTADESRSLLLLINELRTIQDMSSTAALDFDVDSYYKKILESCEGFLQNSGGSTIPMDFQRVEIKEITPIFTLKTGIKTERPTSHFTFPTEEIDRGSYAVVYKYNDPLYDRVFAIKKAKDTLTTDEYDRFCREFDEMKKLSSIYILDVFTFNTDDRYYIMEYADETLENYVENHNSTSDNKQKFKLIWQIFRAFQYLHSKNVLHRDVSPKNILIKHYDGMMNVKVSDFGLVKIPESKLTRFQTEFKGSLNDPQLITIGFRNYEIHHETYALTRLIYYIFSGRISDGVFSNPDFESFFQKGTNFDTAQRYKSVEELEIAFGKIAPSIQQHGI